MKTILTTLTALLINLIIFAQTAPDFTANDCNGNSHNLYSELATGKVIVLNWVMPCSACIGPTLTAYNIVQSYSSGNVLFYLFDDQGNTACSALDGWATNNNIGSNRINFSTTSIDENNYGGSGMPHIMVVGANGIYYFNKLNGATNDPTAIQNAINTALAIMDASTIPDPKFEITTSPNPSSSTVMVNYSLTNTNDVIISVENILGQTMKTFNVKNQSGGNHSLEISVADLPNGNYFLKLSGNKNSSVIKISVQH